MFSESNTPSGRPSRILLVDDHPIVRFALTHIVSQESDLVVCGEASNASEALAAIAACKPEIVLVDVSLGQPNGLELTQTIRLTNPNLPVLVLSMHEEVLYAERALRAGAMGYVMKQEAPETIIAAVRKVLAGDCYLSEKMTTRITEERIHVLQS